MAFCPRPVRNRFGLCPFFKPAAGTRALDRHVEAGCLRAMDDPATGSARHDRRPGRRSVWESRGITPSGLVAGGATANFTVKVVPPGKLVLDLVKFAEGGSDQQAQDADPRGILSRVKYERQGRESRDATCAVARVLPGRRAGPSPAGSLTTRGSQSCGAARRGGSPT